MTLKGKAIFVGFLLCFSIDKLLVQESFGQARTSPDKLKHAFACRCQKISIDKRRDRENSLNSIPGLPVFETVAAVGYVPKQAGFLTKITPSSAPDLAGQTPDPFCLRNTSEIF